jgi:hypothetical protein
MENQEVLINYHDWSESHRLHGHKNRIGDFITSLYHYSNPTSDPTDELSYIVPTSGIWLYS